MASCEARSLVRLWDGRQGKVTDYCYPGLSGRALVSGVVMARRNIEIYCERTLLEMVTFVLTRILIEMPPAELPRPPPLMSGLMHTAATIGPFVRAPSHADDELSIGLSGLSPAQVRQTHGDAESFQLFPCIELYLGS